MIRFFVCSDVEISSFDFVLMLDDSGSMQSRTEGSQTRWGELLEVANIGKRAKQEKTRFFNRFVLLQLWRLAWRLTATVLMSFFSIEKVSFFFFFDLFHLIRSDFVGRFDCFFSLILF